MTSSTQAALTKYQEKRDYTRGVVIRHGLESSCFRLVYRLVCREGEVQIIQDRRQLVSQFGAKALADFFDVFINQVIDHLFRVVSKFINDLVIEVFNTGRASTS